MIATYHYEFRDGKWTAVGKWFFASECGCAHYIDLAKKVIDPDKFYRMKPYNQPIQSSAADVYSIERYRRAFDTTMET